VSALIVCLRAVSLLLVTEFIRLLSFYRSGMTYYPPKSWALLIPTSLVLAFVAAPLLYAACNILATPKVENISTIWDEHAREPCTQTDNNSNHNGYVRAVESVTEVSYDKLQKCTRAIESSHDVSLVLRRSIVPAICDIDVATINALVDSNDKVAR
jgi:hypothetical protein